MKWLAGAILAVSLASCAYNGPSLLGEWSSTHEQSGPNTFTFRPSGSATWTFDAPEVGTFELMYEINYRTRPHLIELSGFDRGVLAGRVLYGLLEFLDDNRFRFAADAGEPGDDDGRPRDFTDAQVYTRERTPPE